MCDPSGTRNFRCHPTNLPPVVEGAPRNDEQSWCPLRLTNAAARSSGMWNENYEANDGPPTNRLWGDDDVAAYVGFRSIDELIARHRDFPTPVPLGMQGRRWRASDVIAWIDQLCAPTPSTVATPRQRSTSVMPAKAPSAVTHVPKFDPSVIAEQLKEASHG